MSLFANKKPLLDLESQDKVVACIREAESKTTGELRVFIENHCTYVDPMERAKELFTELGMIETEKRNAVLVYLALGDRQYALAGDEQIYLKAGGATFWENAAAELKNYLKNGQIAEGLCVCISELGRAMAQHFPFDAAVHRNELPDEIVFGR